MPSFFQLQQTDIKKHEEAKTKKYKKKQKKIKTKKYKNRKEIAPFLIMQYILVYVIHDNIRQFGLT